MFACRRPLSGAGLPSLSRQAWLATSAPSIGYYRSYAVQTGGPPRFQVFNRHAKWLQKERSATNPELSRVTDYLKDEVANRVTERLLVCWNILYAWLV
jgi:NADH dehydrogenase [ubiquinone] 1 alpha subcomplex assembly factor 5